MNDQSLLSSAGQRGPGEDVPLLQIDTYKTPITEPGELHYSGSFHLEWTLLACTFCFPISDYVMGIFLLFFFQKLYVHLLVHKIIP